MSQIYQIFVTNICHYFNLLDKICGKIHAITYYNVSYSGKKQHVLSFLIQVNIRIYTHFTSIICFCTLSGIIKRNSYT